MAHIPLCRPRFLASIFLLPEGHLLLFLVVQLCSWWILLAIVCLKMALLHLCFQKVFLLSKEFWFNYLCFSLFFSFHFLKDLLYWRWNSTVSDKNPAVTLIFIVQYIMYVFPLDIYKIFYLLCYCRKLIMICLYMILFIFLMLGVC